MITVEQATEIIQHNLWKGSSETLPLLNAMGRVLIEDVLADRDFPPFDRVTMDGIAIHYDSYSNGQKIFPIDGLMAAGMPQKALMDLNSCMEVMTGAILPGGADTVIRYEDIKIENGKAEIIVGDIKRGIAIHKKGNDTKEGSILISNGTMISSAEIPLLASVGKSKVKVASLPRTALISTGDELIGVDKIPELHQIRKSNIYALASGLIRFGIQPNFFHLEDNEESIRKTLDDVLNNHDLIILSGGVSKGKFDLIPAMLQTMGIKQHFHQVRQRPGKPMWFGMGTNKVVFALPGNPVSTFMCFYRYVEPWLLTSLGTAQQTSYAILNEDFKFDAPLTYFLQVKIANQTGTNYANPIPGGGSGDFVNLKDVDGFLELPEGKINFKKGEAYKFISFRK